MFWGGLGWLGMVSDGLGWLRVVWDGLGWLRDWFGMVSVGWFVVGLVFFWLQCIAIFYGYSGVPSNGEVYVFWAIEASIATM